MTPRSLGRLIQDQRGIIGAFLLRVVILFGVLAFVGYEAGQIAIARVRAGNVAGSAAQAAADTYFETGRVDAARAEAARTTRTADPRARLSAFHVAVDGAVTVAIVEVARTLIVRRVSFLRRFGVARAVAVGSHQG